MNIHVFRSFLCNKLFSFRPSFVPSYKMLVTTLAIGTVIMRLCPSVLEPVLFSHTLWFHVQFIACNYSGAHRLSGAKIIARNHCK